MNGALRAELLCRGVRIEGEWPGRQGGAGPAEGVILVIDGKPLSVPARSPFVRRSPYAVRFEGALAVLSKDGRDLAEVGVASRPRFYDYLTKEKIPYNKMALLHGVDCLATTVLQECDLWNTKEACRFCGIGLSLSSGKTVAVKDPVRLGEVAYWAKRLDGATHVTLTSGRADRERDTVGHLADCAKAVKSDSGLNVHVQLAPPEDLELLDLLKEAGTDTVGVHVECFDDETRRRVMPRKGLIPIERYEKAWKKAVELFGPGQVDSFVLCGVGEEEARTLEGLKDLAGRGVIPFVVPFRPIPGAPWEERPPPEPEHLLRITEAAREALNEAGLNVSECKAGCVRCGACSA